ncbi:MAG TPA: SUF system NifU family Fe-S cluster assembly protein [Gemmatimonadales bacterium]|jgi:nitrogen fixation NifU-like protein|nr:SUF system NifU family Fe-S cluster assembly protein [Gemmatimonadales bacterium]
MATTNQMYQTLIIEHDRSPRNYKRLDAPTHHAEGRNPLCGDEVSLDLTLDADGVITDVGFQGHGCAVSKASSSMMTTAIKGKTVPEALALFDQFHAMLTGQPGDRDALGKLVAFEGLAVYPMRVKCATMAWHVLKDALSRES